MDTPMQVVYSQEQIAQRIQTLGTTISAAYREIQEPLVAVCVLKGAFVFFSDLVRGLDLDLEIDFVRLASYGQQTERHFKVQFTKDLETSITDRHVLLVEDIVDTGHSVQYLTQVLWARKPKSIRICALVDKKERREVNVHVDYPGFDLAKGFIVGYGLDYAERYRHLGEICTFTDLADLQ